MNLFLEHAPEVRRAVNIVARIRSCSVRKAPMSANAQNGPSTSEETARILSSPDIGYATNQSKVCIFNFILFYTFFSSLS